MPRANKTTRISTRGYYTPRGLYEPWSHVRRRNPRSKKLIRQHLHLRRSHSRKSPKKNPKKWRLSYCLMMMRRTPFKRMCRSLPWDRL